MLLLIIMSGENNHFLQGSEGWGKPTLTLQPLTHPRKINHSYFPKLLKAASTTTKQTAYLSTREKQSPCFLPMCNLGAASQYWQKWRGSTVDDRLSTHLSTKTWNSMLRSLTSCETASGSHWTRGWMISEPAAKNSCPERKCNPLDRPAHNHWDALRPRGILNSYSVGHLGWGIGTS